MTLAANLGPHKCARQFSADGIGLDCCSRCEVNLHNDHDSLKHKIGTRFIPISRTSPCICRRFQTARNRRDPGGPAKERFGGLVAPQKGQDEGNTLHDRNPAISKVPKKHHHLTPPLPIKRERETERERKREREIQRESESGDKQFNNKRPT